MNAEVTGGFWAQRMAANRNSIAHGQQRLEDVGALANLRIAAGEQTGTPTGQPFWDSDVYKWLEAVAWDGSQPEVLRQLTKTIAAAQRQDGYLNSVIGDDRYTRLGTSHEHYCAGHLFQAAVAATGDSELLEVATRFADHLVEEFSSRAELDGHPGVEMALVGLFRETGERRYLDLARHFVNTRGHGHATPSGDDPARYVDRLPVRAADTVEGHAVRAVYFAAGATDVAIEDGDEELLSALRGQFASMRREKQYVNGGLGARWDGEAFGDAYELPPDRAYAETCAAIGGLQWAWRLLLATGEAEYADQVEWLLYNAVLPGVSLTGEEFFYVNTLQRRTGARPDVQRSPAHGRRPWFTCSCCPPNVMRTLASLPNFLATGDGLRIELYAPAMIRSGGFTVEVETDYPWDGRVTVTVREAPQGEDELALRIPDWAAGATVDGEPVEPGYARLRRKFHAGDEVVLELPMQPRILVADHRVDAVRGCVAVARGPLLYALEQPDQEAMLEDLRIDPAAQIQAERRPDLLGGVTVLRTGDLTLIPYYAWANRGQHAMRVWIPT